MSSRNIRNSYRIARRAGQQGARSPVSDQAEVEKLSTDLPSQPSVEANPTESLSQQGPSTLERPATNVDRRSTRQKWTREDYIEVMFCYYMAKADPSEGVIKDTYRIWRGRNPNQRPNLTDNVLMNQRRFIIPVVVGALGTIKTGMVENIKKVSERANVTDTQKISMLGSARILRKVLNV